MGFCKIILNDLKLFFLKLWLYLPDFIHKLQAHFILSLWLFLRPKYLNRLNNRFNSIGGLLEKTSIRKSYLSLYFQILYSYRYQLKIKTPLLKIQIDSSIDIKKDFEDSCLFWSIHYGAFESLHFILQDLLNENFTNPPNRLGVPVTLNKGFINDIRQNQGQSLIDAKQTKELLAWLNAKQNMAILIDQSPSAIYHSIALNSFDEKQRFNLWPELLIKAMNLNYKIYAFSAAINKNEIVFEINKTLAQKKQSLLIEQIEFYVNTWIKNKPEQFVWHYKKTFID